jgi:ribosomal-protein-alanine N-acetyltransferase
MLFEPMQATDVLDVLAIEEKVYLHPWSKANFVDSLLSGYDTWLVRDPSQLVLGYYLLMPVLDEAHLLNIAVRGDAHHQGIGRMLMDHAAALARGKEITSVLLEVRPSNIRALAVYQRYGFTQIGRRKGYYPAADNQREDAVVMRLQL